MAATDAMATFEDALGALDVTLTRTDADDFDEALSAVVEPPAVGAPLPFEGVSLADADVTVDPTTADLQAAQTGVTAAAFAIAEYGTLFLAADPAGTEPVSLYPATHVAVVAASDVYPTSDAAFERLADEFAAGTTTGILATGASATADMGELVTGVHGPGEVHVVVLEDR